MSVWDDIMDTPAEAENMRVRAALMRALRERIVTFGWSQTVAAANLDIPQPRVSELMNGRISKFSLDASLPSHTKSGSMSLSSPIPTQTSPTI